MPNQFLFPGDSSSFYNDILIRVINTSLVWLFFNTELFNGTIQYFARRCIPRVAFSAMLVFRRGVNENFMINHNFILSVSSIIELIAPARPRMSSLLWLAEIAILTVSYTH